MLDIDNMQRFVTLSSEEKRLKEELEEIKKEKAKLEPFLLEAMAESSIGSMKILDKTIYIDRRLWAKYEDRGKAIEALKKAGYSSYVTETFNSNSLSALIREFEANGEGFPKEFDGAITKNEVFKLKVRN